MYCRMLFFIGVLFLFVIGCGGGEGQDCPECEPEIVEQTVEVTREVTVEPDCPECESEIVEVTRAVTQIVEQTVEVTREVEVTRIVTIEPNHEGILDVLDRLDNFEVWYTLLAESGLSDVVDDQPSTTIFAPTDDAFAELGQLHGFKRTDAFVNYLLGSPEVLKPLLFHHILTQERQPLAASEEPLSLETLDDDPLTLVGKDGVTKVDNAQVVLGNIPLTNGSLFGIDQVLDNVGVVELAEPNDLNTEIETWIPYAEGEPLFIGDALLVPGHPLMRQAVNEQASKILASEGAQINVARTVILDDFGTIVVTAPVGPESLAAQFESLDDFVQAEPIIAVTVVQLPSLLSSGTSEPIVLVKRITTDPNSDTEWSVIYELTSEEEFNSFLGPAVVTDNIRIDGTIPIAAIDYGSQFCTYYVLGNGFCFLCHPFADNPSDTREQCEAQLNQ